MRYEWDPVKEESNHRKHGVWFSDAAFVFGDRRAIVNADPDSAEERYVTIGMDGLARLLVVVFTWRGELVRIISARKATRLEERSYAEGDQ